MVTTAKGTSPTSQKGGGEIKGGPGKIRERSGQRHQNVVKGLSKKVR